MRTFARLTIAVLVLRSATIFAADPRTASNTGCVVEPPPLFRVPVRPRTPKLKLLHYVAPDYPALARTARIQGQVVLVAKVTEKGEVQNPEIISAHPLFASAVLAAVKQWRYQPACLEGVPVALDYTIVINFNLSNGVAVQ
jgi:protein TonB